MAFAGSMSAGADPAARRWWAVHPGSRWPGSTSAWRPRWSWSPGWPWCSTRTAWSSPTPSCPSGSLAMIVGLVLGIFVLRPRHPPDRRGHRRRRRRGGACRELPAGRQRDRVQPDAGGHHRGHGRRLVGSVASAPGGARRRGARGGDALAVVAEVALPGAEPGVHLAGGAGPLAGAVGVLAELVVHRQVPGVHGDVAGVPAPGRSRPPQQPPADPSLVRGPQAPDVLARRQDRGGGLDPRVSGDVGVRGGVWPGGPRCAAACRPRGGRPRAVPGSSCRGHRAGVIVPGSSCRGSSSGAGAHQPRSIHSCRCGDSAPTVVSSPWPGSTMRVGVEGGEQQVLDGRDDGGEVPALEGRGARAHRGTACRR